MPINMSYSKREQNTYIKPRLHKNFQLDKQLMLTKDTKPKQLTLRPEQLINNKKEMKISYQENEEARTSKNQKPTPYQSLKTEVRKA